MSQKFAVYDETILNTECCNYLTCNCTLRLLNNFSITTIRCEYLTHHFTPINLFNSILPTTPTLILNPCNVSASINTTVGTLDTPYFTNKPLSLSTSISI